MNQHRLRAALCLFVAATVMDAAQPPNVVVFLSDDQGWGDLSLHGNTNLSTPNIDSLARDGASFDRFFVCPVCSPTRAEFLTGRYHPRAHVYSTSAGGERMDLGVPTIADAFQAAGYATAAYGKWHNGMQYPYHPNARGFADYYGFCSGHWGHYFDPMLEHNGQITQGKGFLTDDFTDHAIAFIEAHQDQPFFVYLPYNTPHSPMQVPDRWWNKFKDHPLPMRHRDPQREDVAHTRAALAMCENIDWNVGRLLKRLEELELSHNTIVVYFCDNGPNGFRWNGGMKGRKGSTDEGGVRSPLLVRWPGKIPPGTSVSRIASAIDLLPTLTDLVGVEHSPDVELDGVSLKPLLLAETTPWPDRVLLSTWNDRVSVRSQRYRLDDQGQLFDLLEDPGQDHDIAAQQPAVAERLRARADAWRRELLPSKPERKRAFVVGHPDFTYTQIPARDGTAHGGIVRSNRFPNCSYFTNWRSLDDQLTWPVEVPADGEFEVEIYYTCPAQDVGSTIEFSFGEASLRGTVTAANDPPVVGAAQDRVPRQESYVKDFKPLRLGRITLRQGSGDLKLQAVSMPGSQVMEFRLLLLTRVE